MDNNPNMSDLEDGQINEQQVGSEDDDDDYVSNGGSDHSDDYDSFLSNPEDDQEDNQEDNQEDDQEDMNNDIDDAAHRRKASTRRPTF
jgi:hypothetical protein